MTTDINTNLHLTINGKPIKQVNELVYLGHTLSATNHGIARVKDIIRLAWDAFEKNKILLTSKKSSLSHQSQCLQNIRTFCCPLWTGMCE